MPLFRCVAVAALCGLPFGAAAAQRVLLPRPDTLGANFDASRPGHGTAADFDFLIGTWQYRYQRRNPQTLAYSSVLVGTWTAKRTHDGLVVEDEFTTPSRDGRRGSVQTYRVFNPADSTWQIQGVNVRRGVWKPGVSWSDGHDRYLVQDNPDLHLKTRIRYYAITANHFLWRADGSVDGGHTWVPDVMLIEATRISNDRGQRP